jgi:tRNA A-37 threonylcarbamoyl transferase component Bud32
VKDSKILAKDSSAGASAPVVREYDISGRDYIVKSIFVGDKDVKATLLNLAEKKAIREMGLDCAVL